MSISVIIPTLNRRQRLCATLDALAGQETEGIDAEVVVVDNGSSDGTPELVSERSRDFPIPLRIVAEPRRGATVARNTGLRVATGDHVLFLGDDTRPAAGELLAAHAEAHREPGARMVLGRVAWAPELEVSPLMRWLEHGPQFDFPTLAFRAPGPEHGYTSHLSLPRLDALAVGGFDERIPFLYEDVDLGRRLLERGLSLVYRPNLLVLHHHPITLRGWARRQRQAGASGRLVGPPLAPAPFGPRWVLARMLAPLALRWPGEAATLPAPLRDRLYAAVHFGSYAAGHRASASGAPIVP